MSVMRAIDVPRMARSGKREGFETARRKEINPMSDFY
jgi:hypothetical protein